MRMNRFLICVFVLWISCLVKDVFKFLLIFWWHHLSFQIICRRFFPLYSGYTCVSETSSIILKITFHFLDVIVFMLEVLNLRIPQFIMFYSIGASFCPLLIETAPPGTVGSLSWPFQPGWCFSATSAVRVTRWKSGGSRSLHKLSTLSEVNVTKSTTACAPASVGGLLVAVAPGASLRPGPVSPHPRFELQQRSRAKAGSRVSPKRPGSDVATTAEIAQSPWFMFT